MRDRQGGTSCGWLLLAFAAFAGAGCGSSLPPSSNADAVADVGMTTSAKPVRLENLHLYMQDGRLVDLFAGSCDASAPYLELKYPFEVEAASWLYVLSKSKQVWMRPLAATAQCGSQGLWLRRIEFGSAKISQLLFGFRPGVYVSTANGQASWWQAHESGVSIFWDKPAAMTPFQAVLLEAYPEFEGAKHIEGDIALLEDGALIARNDDGTVKSIAQDVRTFSALAGKHHEFCWITESNEVKCRIFANPWKPSGFGPDQETFVTGLPPLEWIAISDLAKGASNPANSGPGCVLAVVGEVWCWRHGDPEYVDPPRLVGLPGEYSGDVAASLMYAGWPPGATAPVRHAHRIEIPPATHISVAGVVSCALTTGGEVWCWGISPDLDVNVPGKQPMQEWIKSVGLNWDTGHLPRKIDVSKDVSQTIKYVIDK